MKNHIDIKANYSVTMMNNQTRIQTGECLLHCFLNNSLNRPTVKSYQKVDGQWFDVMYEGQKVWAVYAANAYEAIMKRMDDLKALGKTDSDKLSAIASSFNGTWKPINLNLNPELVEGA